MQETASADKKIRLVVNRIHNLPTPPLVFAQVNKVLNDPDTSAYQIGAIISEDPALSAKILKLTNSAYYGLPRTVTSIKQAIVILGLDAVRSLVLSASVFDAFSKGAKIDRVYLEEFWRHSLSVALMARIISRSKGVASLLEAEESFSAGLLHDIGKLVILTQLPKEFAAIKEAIASRPLDPESLIEQEILGFDHATVGGYLAEKWNMPQAIAVAVANHHWPEMAPEGTTAFIVNAANCLVHRAELLLQGKEIPPTVQLNEMVRAKAGISAEQDELLIERLREEYGKAETFIKMAQGGI